MNKTIKKVLKTAGLYRHYQNWSMKRRQMREFREWKRGERNFPPHLVKQKIIKEYQEKYHLRHFVETGTLHGDMVEAMKGFFEKVYSIELSRELYNEAMERFINDDNVELILGDSGVELCGLVDKLQGPALFWLDGHYSGGFTARGEKDTPIYNELTCILETHEKRHMILIDDARFFDTDPGYPTFEELENLIKAKRPDLDIKVMDDIIRVLPND